MSQISAFVGHSFLPKDDSVVQNFLSYFDQVKGIVPGFSWENAKKAEPDLLFEKVNRLFKDKNLFIGICTSNEAALPYDALRTCWWNSDKLVTVKNTVDLKTSDWIIQEIGFALARDLKIILFVENGVRSPGGMQGNLNYISFNRSSPEKCFGEFLEMIETIMPTASTARTASTSQESGQEEEERETAPADKKFISPKESWTKDDYEFAYLIAVHRDDHDARSKIDEAFRQSSEGRNPQDLEVWEATGEYMRINYHKGGKLERIESIAAKCVDNLEVQHYLGMAYVTFEKYEEAAKCFEKSAAGTENKQTRLRRTGQLARTFVKADNHAALVTVIEQLKVDAKDVERGNSIVVEELRAIAKTMDQDEMWLGLTEYLISITPDRNSERFDLAYKYSDLGQHGLALKHYQEIPINNRSGGEWNNLGVEYGNANLSHKSVKAYRHAEEFGTTLATSNLAYKLISIGFLDEAREMCVAANAKDDAHKNVIHALANISDVPDDEESSLKEVIEGIGELHKFWIGFGEAATDKLIENIDGRWAGQNSDTKVKIRKNRFAAIGEYEVVGFGLGNALLGLAGSHSDKKKFKVTYDGTIFGRSIVCKCMREQLDGIKRPATILGDASSETWTCIMIVNRAGDRIDICEKL